MTRADGLATTLGLVSIFSNSPCVSHFSTSGSTIIFYDLRRRQRGSVRQMTPHQCWNVCDEDHRKKSPSEARLSLPTCTQRKSGKPSFRLWPSHLRKEVHFLSSTFRALHTNKVTPERDGTPSFQIHTEFTLHHNFEGNRPANALRRTCRSLPSPSVPPDALRTQTSHVSFPLHACPRTPHPRQCGNSVPPSPPPSLEQRG